MPSRPKDLDLYRDKRRAEGTVEPFGGAAIQAGVGLFVVQKHAARRLHYDLRLEIGGVLVSWAVPKGPSLDPQARRLAVHVEDHPLDYATFEGVIPPDNYGAGAVIVWDFGAWRARHDPTEGLAKGKLDFDLFGHKLQGRWALVRTGRSTSGREWLLIKKQDAWAGAAEPGGWPLSIYSGLTIEERALGEERRQTLIQRVATAPDWSEAADACRPMLARVAEAPFRHRDWRFELKLDGYRAMLCKCGDVIRLLYRGGGDAAALYPDVVAAVRALPVNHVVLDGELVILDAHGVPNFGRLQQRAQGQSGHDAWRAAMLHPARFFGFDVLALEGRDLRAWSLRERLNVLSGILPEYGVLRRVLGVNTEGLKFFESVCTHGFEGMMAKRLDSVYVNKRSDAWLKVRADHQGAFVLLGWRSQRGGSEIGALLLGAYGVDGRLFYAGRVGSGLSEALREEVIAAASPLQRDDAPDVANLPERQATVTWVEPQVVVRVRFKAWTAQGRLRQPVVLGLDMGLRALDCVHVRGTHVAPKMSLTASSPKPELVRSNAHKIFWPDSGYSKGDLLDYYAAIAPWMLPYLRDRPVVLTRYPDGIEGKSFFQKDAPAWVPGWVARETMWSEHAQREIQYFVCNDVETLVFLANMGTIPFHIWASRVAQLARPDWCILDLDPKDAPFAWVVDIARALHRLCEAVGLPTFVKTSGSTGLHVLIPLGGQCTFEQARTLAGILGRLVEAELPDKATLIRQPSRRGGRVYIDTLQNGHGKLLVAPYALRPLPGAPVSAPLRWREVNRRLDVKRFTLRSMLRRLGRMRDDPLLAVLSMRVDLVAALERLAARNASSD